MYNFKYLLKQEVLYKKKEITDILRLVQKEINEFSFEFSFENASKYNLFLDESRNKRPLDVCLLLRIVEKNSNFLAKEIKSTLMDKIKIVLKRNRFSYKDVIDDATTIRIISRDSSGKRIASSVNISVVKTVEGKDMYIKYNLAKFNYTYNNYIDNSLKIEKVVTYLRNNMLWDEARELFLEKLNQGNRKEDTFQNIFISTLNVFKGESGILI